MEERTVGDAFLKGNFTETLALLSKSKYLTGDELKTWKISVNTATKEKAEKIDPVESSAAIVYYNSILRKMGANPEMSPNMMRVNVIQDPRLSKQDKEQYLLKLESKMNAEVTDGRNKGYEDIEDIIFPKTKGISIETLMQTPQQTSAIKNAQMALDSWIENESKRDTYLTSRDIRVKAQSLANDFSVTFADKIDYRREQAEKIKKQLEKINKK